MTFLKSRLFPKSSQLYTTFGKLCADMNFEDDALKTLKAAIKLNDNNIVALNELAVLHQVFYPLFTLYHISRLRILFADAET